jgi:hypothetical protein
VELAVESKQHNIATRTTGPIGESIGGLETNELFEQFDPARLVVAFQGDLFELQPIADEISKLYDAVVKADDWPFSIPRGPKEAVGSNLGSNAAEPRLAEPNAEAPDSA